MKFIRSDPKLKKYYRKNQFWFWKAIETYAQRFNQRSTLGSEVK